MFNRYVVVLRADVPSASSVSAALVTEFGGVRFYVYETALKGFAVANLPPGAVDGLRLHPAVSYVEEDAVMQPLQSVQSLSSPRDTGLYLLDRIDQRNLPLDWQYSYRATGTVAHVYIIDSGVRGGHQEWGYGRIGNSAAFIAFSWDPSPTIDQLGHGTAVAGAAAGSRVGVAKHATIHSVRIDDGDAGAHTSDIVAGLDWVAANRILPAVANLSYTHDKQSIADAASGVINRGVVFVTSAGNVGGADACDATTQVPSVITVGATTNADYRATYSSIGPCVDLFAPGGDYGGYSFGYGTLELADNESNDDYQWEAGTSFASPVVAGVAAIVLEQNSTLSPSAVADLLVQQATTGVIVNPGAGSPNRLLYSRLDVPMGGFISGPDVVLRGENATWDAQVYGGLPPYTYQWSGILSGSGASITGSPQNSGTLRVLVAGADGRTLDMSRWITVEESCGGSIPC